jgi:hypothetical protein
VFTAADSCFSSISVCACYFLLSDEKISTPWTHQEIPPKANGQETPPINRRGLVLSIARNDDDHGSCWSGSNHFRSFPHFACSFFQFTAFRTRKASPWRNPNTLHSMDLFFSLFFSLKKDDSLLATTIFAYFTYY